MIPDLGIVCQYRFVVLYEKYIIIRGQCTPPQTTSLKNVGLNEPERSGAEYIPAISVTLSPHTLIVVNTADSTVVK